MYAWLYYGVGPPTMPMRPERGSRMSTPISLRLASRGQDLRQVPEVMGAQEKSQNEGSVVGGVKQEAWRHGSRDGPSQREHHAHNQNHPEMGPGASVFGIMQGCEQHCAPHHSPAQPT